MLVDDHAVVRAGYRQFLQTDGDIEVVVDAADAQEAYKQYKLLHPDVVVMDISMPGRGGIDAINHLRQLDPSSRILVFSMHATGAFALQAFKAGAKGYVTKSSPPELLVSAVRDVAAGKIAICPEISDVLAVTRIEDDESILETLSPREFEILRMLLEARSTNEIAKSLNLSPKTVANYHYGIKSKLGVNSDIELVYFGIRNRLVDAIES